MGHMSAYCPRPKRERRGADRTESNLLRKWRRLRILILMVCCRHNLCCTFDEMFTERDHIESWLAVNWCIYVNTLMSCSIATDATTSPSEPEPTQAPTVPRIVPANYRTSLFAVPDIFFRGHMLWPKGIGKLLFDYLCLLLFCIVCEQQLKIQFFPFINLTNITTLFHFQDWTRAS